MNLVFINPEYGRKPPVCGVETGVELYFESAEMKIE